MSNVAETKVGLFPSAILTLRAIFIAFGFVELAFACTAPQFAIWRNERTEFVFHPVFFTSPLTWAIALLTGAAAIQSRQFFLATFLGMVCFAILWPTFAWSGPGDLYNAISPLLMLKLELRFIGFLAEMALLYVWVAPWKDRIKGEPTRLDGVVGSA